MNDTASQSQTSTGESARTGFVYDPEYKKHVTGPGHPERPQRLDAVVKGLKESGLYEQLAHIKPRRATADRLLLCHTQEYLTTVKNDLRRGAGQLSTGDTAICPESGDVALLAVGGVLVAVDRVCGGVAKNAFCAVRPPGHHATRELGMGFCIYNNVAIAARHAQKRPEIERVLIVDWDVHHGNGTQDIFYSDGSVFFFSTHQSPLYPGTGAASETGSGDGKGTTINCPLRAGSGRKEVFAAFNEKLVPAMKDFRPDLVLISAGFDSREGDPVGQMRLTDDDFRDLTRLTLKIAREYAGSRVVSVLEGGYSLDGLEKAATSHVRALVKDGEPARG